MINYKNLLSIALILSAAWASGQNPQGSQGIAVAADFMRCLRLSEKEMVFVQTDKSYYLAGEDIWLKAFCIGSISHKPVFQSESLFVDLVNDRDSVVAQLMLNNASANLDGRISIPATLDEGYFWLRAYTEQQLQDDPGSIYVQSLYFFNGHPKKSTPDKGGRTKSKTIPGASGSTEAEVSVHIYPEGGVIIAGSPTQFAITATDRNGKPAAINGYIKNSGNGVVARYRTGPNGIGTFSFYAKSPLLYSAHTVLADGKELVTPLDKPDLYGFQLSITRQSKDSVIGLVSLGDSVYKKYKPTYILALQRDSLCFAAAGQDMYQFAIPTKNLPGGKINLLLFNAEHTIISQRDIYINKTSPPLHITPDNAAYSRRGKVNLILGTGDSTHKDDPAIYSIAVARKNLAVAQAIPALARFRYGSIDFPTQQLADSAINTPVFNIWDTIMLAQPGHYLGWQSKINCVATALPNEKKLLRWKKITGQLVSTTKPDKERLVTLFYNTGKNHLETQNVPENGKFSFNLPDGVIEGTQLNFQVSTSNGVSLNDSIIIDTLHFPVFSTPAVLKERLPESAIADMDSIFMNRFTGPGWLKPVTVNANRKEAVTYDASKIVTPFSRIIPGDKIGQGANAVVNALLAAPGVTIQGQKIKVMGGGTQSKNVKSSGPLLFIDGVPMSVNSTTSEDSPTAMHLDSYNDPLITYLESINPRFIDFIEVIGGNDAAMFGLGTDGGVIYIHTSNRFRDDLEKDTRGHKTILAHGFSKAPLMLFPDYDNVQLKQSTYPDTRTTLFWNGKLYSESGSDTTVRFFTADDLTDYKVTVIKQSNSGEIQFADYTISCK